MVERSIARDVDRNVLMSLGKKRKKNHFLFINLPIFQLAELEVLNSGVFFCFNNGNMAPLRDVFFNITVKNMLKATFQIQKWGRNSITMAVFKT